MSDERAHEHTSVSDDASPLIDIPHPATYTPKHGPVRESPGKDEKGECRTHAWQTSAALPEVNGKLPHFHHPQPKMLSSTVFGDTLISREPSKSDVLWQLKKFPTLFGPILDDHVSFCIDTSGSMYNCLEAIKEHLIEALFQKAHEERDCTFNLIEFGTEVTQWSDKMVQCTPQTVAVAAEWISRLEVKTGSNMLDALLTAFNDGECEAIVLVTDGNPDQHPAEILDTIAYASQNRPVHCYYVQDNAEDQVSLEFLQDLAMETYGSLHVITVTQHGSIERVTPLYRAELSAERAVRSTHGNIYPSNFKECSVSTTLRNPPLVIEPPRLAVEPIHPCYPHGYNDYAYLQPYRYRLFSPYVGWSRFRHIRGWEKYTQDLQDMASVPPLAPGPGSFLVDTQVLARRNEDGYYYMGKVKSQVCSYFMP